jgi:hypothetical protein
VGFSAGALKTLRFIYIKLFIKWQSKKKLTRRATQQEEPRLEANGSTSAYELGASSVSPQNLPIYNPLPTPVSSSLSLQTTLAISDSQKQPMASKSEQEQQE